MSTVKTTDHIITNFCQPLTTTNVENPIGITAPVPAENKTPIKVLEEIRRQYGIYYYVDKDWDMHFYTKDEITYAGLTMRRGD